MADEQTQPPPQVPVLPARKHERHALRRTLSVAIAALWIAFLSPLAIAQAVGQGAGPPFLSVAWNLSPWAAQQSRLVQISLIVLVAYITVCVVWFTMWAWGTKATRIGEGTIVDDSGKPHEQPTNSPTQPPPPEVLSGASGK